ncbi:minor tail protein [Microbacterium phage Zeta1847]|uniref:Minor tail protein n=1 Tax=Microbacterium phage Zeta1847 TaxID=2201444 RepID=A0A2Z4Q9J4_9CAUD|nr:minor tail protein [Microbacterium phage Zeta1847]AWY06650.1 minor tail protein [Microbacterium phage Zeta1847]
MASPLVAQVRNADLERVGILSDEDAAALKLFPVRNGVGTWELELPHLVRAGADMGHWVRHPKTYSEWVELRRNHFTNPGAVTGTRFTSWAGASGNGKAESTVSGIAWAVSGYARRVTWTAVGGSPDNGDAGVVVGTQSGSDIITPDAEWTVEYDIELSHDATLSAPTPYASTGSYTGIARSHTTNTTFAAGRAHHRWLTFRADATAIANTLRVIQTMYGKSVGSWMQISNVVLYPGRKADFPYIDPNAPAGELLRTRWTSTENLSAVVEESRVITSKPDEFVVDHPAGSWVRHRLAEELAKPGSGIIVDLPGGQRFTGPTLSPEFVETTDDPRGKWRFTGVSDSVVLADRLAYPDPTVADAQASSSSRAYDTRSGAAETLMHAYVDANIGPASGTTRRDTRLVMGTDLGRGASRVKSARFPTLLELCQELAAPDGLLFDVVQVADRLEFRTAVPQDRTSEVRLDVQGDTLDAAKWGYSGPSVTDVVVLGSGEGSERVIRTRSTSSPDAAAWGRVIEVSVDSRGSEDITELDTKGDEVLAANGARIDSLDLVPSAINTRDLGSRYWLGDLVTVNVAGVPVKATVSELRIEVTPEGVYATAKVGDAVGFDPDKATGARLSGVESRVSALERTAEAAIPAPTQGTTAQRDAYYGTPTSDAQRAALANARIAYFNTDLGWMESYYAPTGTAGLAARGLVTGTAAGWYPIGRGPRATLHAASGGQTRTNGQSYEAWQPFGSGDSNRNAGDAFVSAETSYLRMNLAGRWRIAAGLYFPNGSGTGVQSLRVNTASGGGLKAIAKPVPLLGNYGQFIEWEFPDMPVPAGAGAFLYTDAASWTIGGSNSYLAVEYLGPALVTA